MKRMITFCVAISMLALLAGCEDVGSTPETSGQNSNMQQSETMFPASEEAAFPF